MKTEQFIDHTRVEIWFPSRPMKIFHNQTRRNFTEISKLTTNE